MAQYRHPKSSSPILHSLFFHSLLFTVAHTGERLTFVAGGTPYNKAPRSYEKTINSSEAQDDYRDGRLLGSFNCEQVAFYKTHKTGSTDLGAVLFRVGVRRGKRFVALPPT
jgi:hypothetical protein